VGMMRVIAGHRDHCAPTKLPLQVGGPLVATLGAAAAAMRRRTIGLDKIAIHASNPTGTLCVMSDDEPRLAGRPCQDNSELGETIFRRAPGAVPRRWLKSSPLRHCSMNRD
jgi:hypothetical protein